MSRRATPWSHAGNASTGCQREPLWALRLGFSPWSASLAALTREREREWRQRLRGRERTERERGKGGKEDKKREREIREGGQEREERNWKEREREREREKRKEGGEKESSSLLVDYRRQGIDHSHPEAQRSVRTSHICRFP